MISVLIATKDRWLVIEKCLSSILDNLFSDYEIIVIDQSNSYKTQRIIKKLQSSKIRSYRLFSSGKSRALNFAVQKSKGEILAFTDDDCIVDKNWLKEIAQSFQDNLDIMGVFGKVLPYNVKNNLGKICPSILLKSKKMIIDKPLPHYPNVGIGNNMAFKSTVFEQVGKFKEWLGPGSIGMAAEDADITLRMLHRGYQVLYNPKIKVYHNRWLTDNEFFKLGLAYSCGRIACYEYLFFKGINLGKLIVRNEFYNIYKKARLCIKLLLTFNKSFFNVFINLFIDLYYKLKGLLIGYWFSVRDSVKFSSKTTYISKLK